MPHSHRWTGQIWQHAHTCTPPPPPPHNKREHSLRMYHACPCWQRGKEGTGGAPHTHTHAPRRPTALPNPRRCAPTPQPTPHHHPPPPLTRTEESSNIHALFSPRSNQYFQCCNCWTGDDTRTRTRTRTRARTHTHTRGLQAKCAVHDNARLFRSSRRMCSTYSTRHSHKTHSTRHALPIPTTVRLW